MPPGFWSTAVATGLAGFDPAPMLIAAAALTGGVRRRHLFGFAAVLLGGTALVGWLLSRTLGHLFGHLDWPGLLLGHRVSGVIELVAGLALAAYAAYRIGAALRWGRPRTSAEPERVRGVAGLYVVAVTFALIVVGDPAFALFVGLSGDQRPISGVIGWVIWATISQFPLVILMVAAAFGAAHRVAAAGQRLKARLAPTLRTLTTVLVLAAALLAIVIGVVTLSRTL